MPTRYLGPVEIPGDSQMSEREQRQRQLARQSALQDLPAVETVSSDPGDHTLSGQYRGAHAEKLAAELQELVEYAGIETVPFTTEPTGSPLDAFYSIQSGDFQPLHPQEPRLQRFEVALVREGTPGSHYRAVTTAPSQPENGTDAGNDTTGYVGVPAAASKVRWFNPEAKTTVEPTVATTRSGEHGDIQLYDALNDTSIRGPTLLYELPLGQAWQTDVQVWDGRGHGLTGKTDADDVVQWWRVFSPEHDYTGRVIVSNRVLRLAFDESSNEVKAERWDAGTSAWSSVTLPESDWEVFDVDVTEIGFAEARAQVEFRDPTQSPTAYYSLDMVLPRGYESAQWFNPPGESPPAPTGLIDPADGDQGLLDPIADTSVVDPQAAAGLVARSEVRK